MKKHIQITAILLSFVFTSCAQENFTLKMPDAKALKKEFIKRDYQMNVILTFFERNYKATSDKLDIKLDPDFDNAECGFTKKFAHGIVYTYYNCGEAMPVKEEITIPKVEIAKLKKWIELINASLPYDIKNVWYPNKNEYGPEDKEAGCYYTIKDGKETVTINTWCGS